MPRKAHQEHFRETVEDTVYQSLGIHESAAISHSEWQSLHTSLTESSELLYSAYNRGGPLASKASEVWRQWISDVEQGGDVRRGRMMALAYEAIERSPKDLVSLVLSTGPGYDAALVAAAYPDRRFMASEVSEEAVKSAMVLKTRLDLVNLDVVHTQNEELLNKVRFDECGSIIGNWSLSGCVDPGKMVGRLCDLSHHVVLTESPVVRWRIKPDIQPFANEPYYFFVEKRQYKGRELMIPKVYVNDLRQSVPEGAHLMIDTTRECLSDTEYDSYMIGRDQPTDELSSDGLIFQHLVRINNVRRALKEKLGL